MPEAWGAEIHEARFPVLADLPEGEAWPLGAHAGQCCPHAEKMAGWREQLQE